MDHLHTLNDLTPKIRCQGKDGVDPDLIFGFDTKLYSDPAETPTVEGSAHGEHHDEVETVTIWRGKKPDHVHVHDEHCGHDHHENTAPSSERHSVADEGGHIDRSVLETSLNSLSKESVWRVKGFVRFDNGIHILNWAFGRFEVTGMQHSTEAMDGVVVRLTAMGERGEVKRAARKFAASLGADLK